jgi:tetratricopeptide (TPR) repeat protein
MKICPKCKRRTGDERCDNCQLVFAEYEQRKQEETAQVYKLISSGELEQAKDLAQTLSNEFPDSKGDFILLISNINRDLNIAGKYRQAQKLFDQGDYEDTALLLRNLKAFDPGLSEKLIALRRQAQRRSGDSSKFEQAAELFAKQDYDAARKLLRQLKGGRQQQDAEELLAKIEAVKEALLREAVDSAGGNFFNAARERLETLIRQFPEARQEQAALLALLDKRRMISEKLAAAAAKAKQEKRLLEAKVLYSFLICQDPDLRPSLLPKLEEIGPQPAVSLAEGAPEELTGLADLGIMADSQGLLHVLAKETSGQTVSIAPVLAVFSSPADQPSQPVDIDGEEVADFV